MIGVVGLGTAAVVGLGTAAVVGLGTAAVVGLGVAHGVTTKVRSGDRPIAVSKQQTSLTDVADILSSIGSGAGFAGLTVDEARRRITSYWVGSAPQDVVDYAKSNPHGVTIEIVTNAKHSRADLGSAAERIANSSVGDAAGVSSVAAREDGSGLTIDLKGDTPSAAVTNEIADIAGIPTDDINYHPHNGLIYLPAKHKPPSTS